MRPTSSEDQRRASQRASPRDDRCGDSTELESCSVPPTGGIALDSEALELLAELVAAKLDARQAARVGWVGAEDVATHLAVNVQWVYDHGYELGGIRLGDGTRQGRWRFKLDRIDERLEKSSSHTSESPTPSVVRRQRQRSLGAGVELLPVKGCGGGLRDS